MCSSLMTWSMSWRHTSLCASVRYTVEEGTVMIYSNSVHGPKIEIIYVLLDAYI